MSESYIAMLQNGVPSKGHTVSGTTTSAADNVRFGPRRMARLFSPAADAHYRFVHDILRYGDFQNPAQWMSAAGEPGLVAGNIIRPGGEGWIELGPTGGQVILNATAPLAGQSFDALMALDDQDTQLFQMGKGMYPAGETLVLAFNHLDSGTATIDYAIVRPGVGEAINYLQAGGTFATTAEWFTATTSATDVQVLKTFTADIKSRYGVIFRPTTDQASETSQIARVFFAGVAIDADPELPAGIPEYVLTGSAGHFSFKMDTGTATIQVAEMQPA